MKKDVPVSIHWFRRDLRITDNKALYYALRSRKRVLPLFIFDDHILDPLARDDHRVSFIFDSLHEMHQALQQQGRGLLIRKGKPADVFQQLLSEYAVEAVYCNADHEPYGRERDRMIAELLKNNGVAFHRYLDHVIMKFDEVLTAQGTPYQVFTPYSRAWKGLLKPQHTEHFSSEQHLNALLEDERGSFPGLDEIGFRRSPRQAPPKTLDAAVISTYHQTRDIPAIEGTSRLGVHLRFGTISLRSLVRKALQLNEVFLNELIWREFYAMILWHYPEVVGQSFKPSYDRIEWRNDPAEFERWKSGTTGYPMVDAGMRQLNATGYMHNRLRMITASFLTKHLLTDWRWGEAYFAEKLFDYELSSNNGGWQWSAGTGCDAAPYFRVFNPEAQQKKFDPQLRFVKTWVAEFGSKVYPDPIVGHNMARERCLHVYKAALSG
ncbi:MAG: deoxyribodipyrimidine photo-lyase [Bacteroidales bacterium]|nr:deoxyribodipyrimidine photo-lyase [Bacteroidales bacterium]